tara:strand:+ start:9935 stop:10117 length:183 start_codon:yes stop_codon:yes gene_type:complete
MSVKLKDINTLNYINFTMDEINNLTADIYESLMDDEYSDLSKTIDVLIKKLNDIKKTHKK